jgi:capsular polysaccharide export protein
VTGEHGLRETPTAHPRREILFLQGLAGPFFARLGAAMAAAGHGVHRVNFHGGDWLFWRRAGAVDYRGGLSGWPDFLAALLAERGITDIVLFGDCRPLHKAATFIAAQRNIVVHVFEEGYMRPDWVTLEVGGVNGRSSLPRDPAYYLETAQMLPPAPVDSAPVPSSFGRRAREDVAYNVAAALSWPLYPGFRTHRPVHPFIEYAGWIGRLARRGAARRRSEAVSAALADGQPYFVFPLQLDSDYQIRIHSPYKGMRPAIEHVLSSFAAHAAPGCRLVVKAHPLDEGLHDWRGITLAVAERLGLGGRVLFLEVGDIERLVRPSLGMVTVNSTSGTLALTHDIPVLVLGHAVYDIPRVTHQGSLDSFWSAPQRPEAAVFAALRRVLVHRSMIRGGFFSEEGLAMLVEAAAARIEQAATASLLAPDGVAPEVGAVVAGAPRGLLGAAARG